MPNPGQLRSFKSFEVGRKILGELPKVKTFKEEEARPTSSERGYGRDWNSYRRWYLRQHTLCLHCGRLATLVDHIHAIRFGGSRMDPKNHQPLCRECHARKTAQEEAQAKAQGLTPLWQSGTPTPPGGKGGKSSAQTPGKPPGAPL
mgnify:CR=1 FL=1